MGRRNVSNFKAVLVKVDKLQADAELAEVAFCEQQSSGGEPCFHFLVLSWKLYISRAVVHVEACVKVFLPKTQVTRPRL